MQSGCGFSVFYAWQTLSVVSFYFNSMQAYIYLEILVSNRYDTFQAFLAETEKKNFSSQNQSKNLIQCKIAMHI